MGSTRRRVIASLLVIGVLAGTAGVAGASPRTAADRVRSAIAYLATQQRPNGSIPAFSPIGSTSDAVLSIVVAGVGKPQLLAALVYLRRQVVAGKVNTIGLQAKVAMAVAAAGRDPRSFGDVNLVKALRATIGPGGRFGDAPVFDDALAMIALEASNAKVPTRAVDWLLDAQCSDGGWQYDEPASAGEDESCRSTTDPANDFFASDTNTTSYAVQAVEASGGGVFANDPFAFFGSIRDATYGGWGYSWGVETTDANSTALVIQAYASANMPVPDGAVAALRALQDPACGGWSFTWVDGPNGPTPDDPNPGATIGAVLGVLRRPLPVPPGVVQGRATPRPGCG